MSPNSSLSKKDLTLMLFNYQAGRIKSLEGREKWLITIVVAMACAVAGIKIGVI